MNSEKTGSAANSDAPSKTPPDRPTDKPADKLTEAQFLARQADQARQAMTATMHQMVDKLGQAADPRAWTGEHPWYALGAAAILGFVAASALTPARGESFKERIEELFPDSDEDGHDEEEIRAPRHPKARASKKKPSKLWSMAAPLMDSVKTALVSTISSAVTAKVGQNPSPPPDPSRPSTDPTSPAS